MNAESNMDIGPLSIYFASAQKYNEIKPSRNGVFLSSIHFSLVNITLCAFVSM